MGLLVEDGHTHVKKVRTKFILFSFAEKDVSYNLSWAVPDCCRHLMPARSHVLEGAGSQTDSMR